MLAPKCTTQPNVRCWVWFKGNPLKHEGCWKGGMELSLFWGGVRIEHLDALTCRFPSGSWSSRNQPDMENSPSIPEGERWKLYPSEPK